MPRLGLKLHKSNYVKSDDTIQNCLNCTHKICGKYVGCLQKLPVSDLEPKVFPDSALQREFRVPRNSKYDGGFGSPIRYVSGNNVTINIMIKSRCWTSTYEWTE